MASQAKTQSLKSITRPGGVLDHVAAGIFVADSEFNIVFVNARGSQLLRNLEEGSEPALRITADRIVGKNLWDLDQDPARQAAQFGRHRTGRYKTEFKCGSATLRVVLERWDRDDDPVYIVTWDDVSKQVQQADRFADFTAQVEAIGKSQAVIEFEMDGTIITANDRFLDTMGYRLDEIVGQHHRMFVDEATRQSAEYEAFWQRLGRGEYETGEYKRIGKGGKEVWLQSSYNAILDSTGKPFKVVKYASDVTQQVVNRTNMAHVLETVTRSAEGLASASEQLTQVSQQMGANAEETSAQANVVASAAEQVSHNVTTVATGIEELNASIGEIASNASRGAQVAENAVEVADSTTSTITKLGDSSTEIGNVIKVITSIAEQTNLLALNATIEAARAGEAGKGFAVVANEVKELAKETARATEDIGQKIEMIQADTRAAIEAINQISAIINQVNDLQATIAAAVEQQTATTSEMSRSIAEAATGSTEIARNIAGVADAARHTTTGANDSQNSAAELARMASELQDLVAEFNLQQQQSPQQEDAMLREAAAAIQALQGTSTGDKASQVEQLRKALQHLVSGPSRA